MANRVTVFYSWQSDTPSSVNRDFIEKALNEALNILHSDALLESALRDTKLELDKDTEGVAGSPPIADTILKKIEGCAVFVADLTFVAQSMSGLTNSSGQPRLVSNPNVLIEYGYALRCSSHSAIVGVMNTAFGEPKEDSLPFDLRHLLWPIPYHLSQNSNGSDTAVQLEKLTTALVKALRLILNRHSTIQEPAIPFVPQKATKNAALFCEDINNLCPEGHWGQKPDAYTIPEGGKVYLRLYPAEAVPPINTELEAEELAGQGRLRLLGNANRIPPARNVFGSIVCEPPHKGKLYRFTQLFLSREIWGVDAGIFNHDYVQATLMPTAVAPTKCILIGDIEISLVNALENFLSMAKSHLNLGVPLHVEAGLVGIKGFLLYKDGGLAGRRALHDSVQWKGVITSDKPAWEILVPFFDLVWANCAVKRTVEHQAEFAKMFEQRH